MQAVTVCSLAEFHEVVRRLEQSLLDEGESVKGPDKFWYRGVDNGSYTLTPSLYRYRDPIEKEQLLFSLHNQSSLVKLGSKIVSWERVIHMQHYNIPTRLLDWTANLWIAVFFALTFAPIQPCIYILNPLRLNRKSKQDGLVRVPMDSRFDFEEHFFGNPVLSPHNPLAIIPVVSNGRLIHQEGRFTVQGRDPEPLERQAPECIAKIDLLEPSHAKLRDELARAGINGPKVFPDHEGVAQFVRSEARLKPIPYDESIASRIRNHLKTRAQHDLYALTHKDENREPYSKGITFCNLDEAYLRRDASVLDMAAWLKDGPPFLFVTGKVGVGKTNFTLHTLLCSESFHQIPFVFFSFKLYGSRPARVDRHEGIGELAGYLYDMMLNRTHMEQERHVARQMISEGDVVLALDGLDELARIRGGEAVEEVGRGLDALFGGRPKARIVITCRDHILARLKGTGALGKTKNQREIKLSRFPAKTVRTAVSRQLAKIPDSLIAMACIPLFYEMIRRARNHWLELITVQANRTKLEETWFKVILRENHYSDLDFRRLGAIAGKMLHDRSDLLRTSSISPELTALLKVLSIYPIALFVEELKDTYSFSHQSLREFVLAWCVAKEIKSCSFDLLTSSGSFDYEGHEFYARIRDLLDINKDVIEQFPRLVNFAGLNESKRNHLVRNLFERLGELTPGGNSFVQRIAETALPYLKPATSKTAYITYKTKYNTVRCLERIHWSAPRPYIDHIAHFSWWQHPHRRPFPGEYHIYAHAIRGFHRQRQEPTSTPPMVYKKYRRSALMKNIEDMVSDRLMAVIEKIKEHELTEDGIFLGINCTFALIRWLSRIPDLGRIEGLLQCVRASVLNADHRY